MHPGRPLGGGRSQNGAVDQAWTREHDLLRHETANREAEDFDAVERKCVDKRECPTCHLCDSARGNAGRAPDANVVERQDPSFFAQSVDQRRVPVVQVPPEVLEKKEGVAVP